MDKSKKVKIIVFLFFFVFLKINAQRVASDSILIDKKPSFNYQSFIAPAILLSYGIAGLENEGLKSINQDIHHQIVNQNHANLRIDNYTQYAPALSVYGLNAFGIKGKNNFEDRTIILATASLIMTATTLGLKSMTTVVRPDNSSDDSFPSGHVAKSFMGAEFLFQEYKDVSLWYGITGYVVAVGTGFLRIYNNKHWLTDVAAGAGIGILSTKVAYLIKPFIDSKVVKGNQKYRTVTILPGYDGENLVVGLYVAF